MSDVVIRVENLCKEYRLGTISHGTLYRDIQSGWAKLRGTEDPNARIGSVNREQLNTTGDRFCALKDVSFDVRQGEIVGIIGRNGAGKSTLLKIISRVTAPTSGTIKIQGRVASLLEVGTGFHPELTGRENIFLNGAILGMHKGEIEQKFEEIVAFSEIDKFIDTPVKRYSSGMYVRLAFAVAAHLEPEILVVDEVLAVGDIAFQKKCLGKMGNVAKEGRTVLLVSHNMAMITNLCNQVILLDCGRIIVNDQANKVVQEYLSQNHSSGGEVVWSDHNLAPGKDIARLHAVRILQEGFSQPTSDVEISKDIFIQIEYWNLRNGAFIHISIDLTNAMGVLVFSTSCHQTDWDNHPKQPGFFRSVCCIPGNFLNEGRYIITINLVKTASNIPEAREEDLLSFQVHDTGEMQKVYYSDWPGVVRPLLVWQTEYQGPLDGRFAHSSNDKNTEDAL